MIRIIFRDEALCGFWEKSILYSALTHQNALKTIMLSNQWLIFIELVWKGWHVPSAIQVRQPWEVLSWDQH